MKNAKIIVPAVALTLIAGGLFAWRVSDTLAVSNGNGANNRENMAEELSSKLNVSEDQVTSALDQIRTDRQKERQEQVSSKLDEAVTDGVITADQKQKILDKQAEERTQMQNHRTEMQKWFADNGIDSDKIHDYIGYGKGMGGGGHGRMSDSE